MPFFKGAGKVEIRGGTFQDIVGDMNKFDYSTHVNNKDSYNSTTTTTKDSYNNSSVRYESLDDYDAHRGIPPTAGVAEGIHGVQSGLLGYHRQRESRNDRAADEAAIAEGISLLDTRRGTRGGDTSLDGYDGGRDPPTYAAQAAQRQTKHPLPRTYTSPAPVHTTQNQPDDNANLPAPSASAPPVMKSKNPFLQRGTTGSQSQSAQMPKVDPKA